MQARDALAKQIQRFLDHLTVERGLSGHTIGRVPARPRSLRQLPARPGDRGRAEVTRRRWPRTSPPSPHRRTATGSPTGRHRSCGRSRRSARSTGSCCGRGRRDATPRRGSSGRSSRVPAQPLSVEDVAAGARTPRSLGPRGLRDRAVLETLYGAGLRISELAGLDVDDVDLEEGSVRVLGKGSKERDVPIGRYARDAISALPDAGPAPARDGALAFGAVPEPARRPADAPGVHRNIQQHAVGADIRKKVSPARVPALLRHAPARGRRGRAGRPGAARARERGHHPGLYAGDARSTCGRSTSRPTRGRARPRRDAA